MSSCDLSASEVSVITSQPSLIGLSLLSSLLLMRSSGCGNGLRIVHLHCNRSSSDNSSCRSGSTVFSPVRQGSFRLVVVSGWGHSRRSTRFTVHNSPNLSAGSITYTSFFPFLATTLYTFPSQTSWILLRPRMSRFLRYTRCPNDKGRSRALRS